MTLITAFAKIGGLMALLKFSIVLRLYHEYLFHKKINRKVDEHLLQSFDERTTDVKELITFERISEMMSTIEDQQRTIEQQARDIHELRKHINLKSIN